jgi:hypothetical protein
MIRAGHGGGSGGNTLGWLGCTIGLIETDPFKDAAGAKPIFRTLKIE